MDTKIKQFFTLMILSVVGACVFVFSGCFGCGQDNCELPQVGSNTSGGLSASGVSIPGLGGCLTYGWGCDNCLWAQSYKAVTMNASDISIDNTTLASDVSIIGCDTEYYGCGGSCLGCGFGCGYDDDRAYVGLIRADTSIGQMSGIFCGRCADNEMFVGCVGCVPACLLDDGNVGGASLEVGEYVADVY